MKITNHPVSNLSLISNSMQDETSVVNAPYTQANTRYHGQSRVVFSTPS